METVFFGRLVLIFVGFYLYEKAIQKWDPLLRQPWAWDETDRKYNRALKKQKARKTHLKVVK